MVRSPYPYSCNLNKLLPKVLVSTQSAPAARYFRWIVFIHWGRVRVRPSLKPSFFSGKSSGCGDNFWISVPIAPSKRTTLLFISSSKESVMASSHSWHDHNFTFCNSIFEPWFHLDCSNIPIPRFELLHIWLAILKNDWAHSSAWIEWLPAEQLVEGSSPSGPAKIKKVDKACLYMPRHLLKMLISKYFR